MEVDAVGAEIGEAVHGLDRIERRPRLVAERIAATVADRPQPEREAIGRRRFELLAHGELLRALGRVRKRMLVAVTQYPPPPSSSIPPPDDRSNRQHRRRSPPYRRRAADARSPTDRSAPRGSAATRPTTSSPSGPRSAGRCSRAASTASTSCTSSCGATATTSGAGSSCSTRRRRSRGNKPTHRVMTDELRAGVRTHRARSMAVLRAADNRVPRPGHVGPDRLSSPAASPGIVAYVLLDGDLVTHDHAEGAIEAELSADLRAARCADAAARPGPAQGPRTTTSRRIIVDDRDLRHLRALVALRRHGRMEPALRAQLALGRRPRRVGAGAAARRRCVSAAARVLGRARRVACRRVGGLLVPRARPAATARRAHAHRHPASGRRGREGLVRHCTFPVPRWLCSGGVGQSWEWLPR